jgi:hypothetical protein
MNRIGDPEKRVEGRRYNGGCYIVRVVLMRVA